MSLLDCELALCYELLYIPLRQEGSPGRAKRVGGLGFETSKDGEELKIN